MNSNSNYETLYGVGLLDDLHNYFPSLLYDSSGFRSVQDVLTYMQRQTRNRFDLFSYGQREYLSRHPQPTQPPSDSFPRVVRSSVAVPPVVATAGSTLPTTLSVEQEIQSLLRPATLANTTSPMNIAFGLNQTLDDEDDISPENITHALLSLLRLPTGSLTRTYTNVPTTFMQPVVVRPSQEQIDTNTTVGRLVSDTEHSCPICQDSLTNEQEGRKLNACGHWFHKNCIDTWFQSNVRCPVCRHDIRDPVPQTTPEAS